MVERLRALFVAVYRRVYWSKFGNHLSASVAVNVVALSIVGLFVAGAILLHNFLPQGYLVIALFAYCAVFVAGCGLVGMMEAAKSRAMSDLSEGRRIKAPHLEKSVSRIKGIYIAMRDHLARMALFVDRWTGGTPETELNHRGNPAILLMFGLIVCLPMAIFYILLPHSYRIISLFPVAPAVLMGSDVIWQANRMRREGKETGRFPWWQKKNRKPPRRKPLEDCTDNQPVQGGGNDQRRDDVS